VTGRATSIERLGLSAADIEAVIAAPAVVR
jgi:hypothetical protein